VRRRGDIPGMTRPMKSAVLKRRKWRDINNPG
jgi:hypothetical protein